MYLWGSTSSIVICLLSVIICLSTIVNVILSICLSIVWWHHHDGMGWGAVDVELTKVYISTVKLSLPAAPSCMHFSHDHVTALSCSLHFSSSLNFKNFLLECNRGCLSRWFCHQDHLLDNHHLYSSFLPHLVWLVYGLFVLSIWYCNPMFLHALWRLHKKWQKSTDFGPILGLSTLLRSGRN